MRWRVLSPHHPGVLALSQGRADLFALRSARVPCGATRFISNFPRPLRERVRVRGCMNEAARVLSPSSPPVLAGLRRRSPDDSAAGLFAARGSGARSVPPALIHR
jgi:hypothetical protein